jgi:ribulose-phosphate 3-epimerase
MAEGRPYTRPAMAREEKRWPSGHVLISASILDADAMNLEREIHRGELGGVDRFHLDVMDGHFVPNITFGPATVAAVRRVTKLPLDVHLMISEPSRFVPRFIDAGADSVTFHVEVAERKEPILAAIRDAGRAAGLAINPETPLSAIGEYLHLLDIAMVMGVHPGFGGQRLIEESVAKIPEARRLFEHRDGSASRRRAEIHIDGGVQRDNVERLGAAGVDVLVAGSSLYREGLSLPEEVAFLRGQATAGRGPTSTDPRQG